MRILCIALLLLSTARSDEPDHWAWKKPVATNASIDALIAKQQQGLKPAPPAAPATWLRRAHLDLIGLPPTREQLHAFLKDSSPAAREKVVDQLLADPAYGERWGRHWMDVWRYSDWDGYKEKLRGSQKFIWHWRDWIIDSLNADKGYDQMIKEMLAGDELAPMDPKVLRATGFLARNFHNSNRNIWLDRTVEHTAKAFLGTTMNCARCHDHKADPIPIEDYYRMRAIFEPYRVRIDPLPGQLDPKTGGFPRAFDANLTTNTFVFVMGNEKTPDREKVMPPSVPKAFGQPLDIKAVTYPVSVKSPGMQDFVLKERRAAANAKVREASTKHRAQLKAKKDAKATRAAFKQAKLERSLLRARIAADQAKMARKDQAEINRLSAEAAKATAALNLHKAERAVTAAQVGVGKAKQEKDEKKRAAAVKKAEGELKKKQAEHDKARKTAEKPGTKYAAMSRGYPGTSTGRRLALANWIASKNNPLAARVAVNHIWMRHFGTPLVDQVFDFGKISSRPLHAELLDTLAVQFMDSGWNMKPLHKRIVLSEAWGRASTPSVEGDPENRLYTRANVRRLEGEIIRDGLWSVSGGLDRNMGGPEIDFMQGGKVARRSVYFRHAYEKQMQMLVQFDPANPAECYRRSESISPQQALTLANSALSVSRSRVLAQALWKQKSEEDAFILAAFETVLSRPPDDAERAKCRQFVQEQAKLLAGKLVDAGGTVGTAVPPSTDPLMRARENLVHVLFNHNDFVMVR